ncbi:MAG: AAA family ATPase [Gammaproteobacteria bacterium RIFCSPHIGHO2_12_FULL_45_9]|nr:MAG: AAA family ATPase [Gammaproteobacteria bacterium RIFCSPHIGHO2_12_FULL_45_9]
MATTFQRAIAHVLHARLQENRKFIQVVAGPRQVGKTTLVLQVMQTLDCPTHYVTADEPQLRSVAWIQQQWDIARLKSREIVSNPGAVLVLDEIQKIPQWSETVKRLWDEDTRLATPVKVVVLGSAPLLVQQGLTESLAGRFEIIPLTHWSYLEMQAAFGWTLPQFIYFGGYPGSAALMADETRWTHYVLDALVETTLAKDILLLNRVDKPALLRQLFGLGCQYSSQILSYQKMLGQLHDAGNTTTLAHYLKLLSGAGMLTGLPKFTGNIVRQKASSPKLQVQNTALMSTSLSLSFQEMCNTPDKWGRLVESAVGAHLLNGLVGTRHITLSYWREGHQEVDFVLHKPDYVTAIEVKSGQRKEALSGMETFATLYKPQRLLEVGGQGLPLETFFTMPVTEWVQ